MCKAKNIWIDHLELIEGPGTDVQYYTEKITRGTRDTVVGHQVKRPWGSSKVSPCSLQSLVFVKLAKLGMAEEELLKVGVAPGIAKLSLKIKKLNVEINNEVGTIIRACDNLSHVW